HDAVCFIIAKLMINFAFYHGVMAYNQFIMFLIVFISDYDFIDNKKYMNMNSANDKWFDPLKYYIGPVTNTLLFVTIRRDKLVEEICCNLSKISLDDQSSGKK
ncbi:MAG: hypothetical protein WD512_17435, partial [Candidatus Paceibacterota bacterium]